MDSDESSSVDDDNFFIYEESGLIEKNPGKSVNTFLLEHGKILSTSEKDYISLYDTIWYYTKNLERYNCDKDGRYKIKNGDSINCRYQIRSSLGKGTFSNVYKVFDYKYEEEFALKIIRNESRFIKQSLKEIKLLVNIDHPNCIKVLNVFNFNKSYGFIFPVHSHNLYEELKSNNMEGLSEILVKRYGKEILLGLDYLKNKKIIHCDLKPENIMIDLHGNVKIIDFGSSFYEKEITKILTYIQSRYYRAPEVPLGLGVSCAIDMWSFACILYELLTGEPLFRVKSEKKLILSIIATIDMPPDYIIKRGNESMRLFRFSRSKHSWVLFENLYHSNFFPGCKPLSITNKDLEKVLNSCLQWEPTDRCYPSDLLSMDYFN